MNVTKCINGHFFDADKYPLCPHCGAVATAPESAANEAKKPHTSFWGKKKKATNDGSIVEMPDKSIGKTFGVFGNDEDKKKTEQEGPEDATPEGIIKCSLCGNVFDSTLYADCPLCACQRVVPIDRECEAVDKSVPIATQKCPQCNQTYTCVSLEGEECPHCGYNPHRIEHTNDEPESLSEAVKKAASSNEGKTVGFFSAGTKNGDAVSNEPVVGWLVCVKGSHFGEAFTIFAGRNSIGRGESNKINIAKDDAVSRSKHAWLTYEPKKRDFYIQPGEGTGLSYLNGDTVMESKKLQAKDMLEFGNGQYLLIPLCDGSFTWEDYIDKE